MKRAIGMFLFLSAAAEAADAPAPAEKPEAARAEPAAAQPRKLLNLRVGDVRRYMTPAEYQALINPQVEERNTVIVQADAPLVPMKSELDVPGGILAPFWALANPRNAWRIFLPDARAREIPPPASKIPQRSVGLGPLKPGE